MKFKVSQEIPIVKIFLFISLTMLSFMFFRVLDTYKQEEEIFLSRAEFRVDQDLDSHDKYHLDERCDLREWKIKFQPINYKDQIYEAEIQCASGLLTDTAKYFTVRAQAYRRGPRLMYIEYKFDRGEK